MIARPTVVLPQPDSPTSPSVSPRSSVERHAVDGAHLARLARKHAAEDREPDVQVLNFENRLVMRPVRVIVTG